jgi:hypothetical protein
MEIAVKEKARELSDREFTAPQVKRFSDPLDILIFAILCTVVVAGLAIACIGTSWSTLLALILEVLAVLAWKFGEIRHSPSDPREVGVITFRGTPLKNSEGKIRKVMGNVILAPYWPIELGTYKIVLDNSKKDFDFMLTSRDGIVMTTKFTLLGHPDLEDLDDFNQAGADMEDIWQQNKQVVFMAAQLKFRENKAEDIQSKPSLIIKDLVTDINEVFKSNRLGVKLFDILMEAKMPETLQKDREERQREIYQREGDLEDYRTIRIAALELQIELARDQIEGGHEMHEDEIKKRLFGLVQAGKIPNLDQCIEKIRKNRQDKQGHSFRMDTDTKGGTMHVSAININTGDNKEKDKKK